MHWHSKKRGEVDDLGSIMEKNWQTAIKENKREKGSCVPSRGVVRSNAEIFGQWKFFLHRDNGESRIMTYEEAKGIIQNMANVPHCYYCEHATDGECSDGCIRFQKIKKDPKVLENKSNESKDYLQKDNFQSTLLP